MFSAHGTTLGGVNIIYTLLLKHLIIYLPAMTCFDQFFDACMMKDMTSWSANKVVFETAAYKNRFKSPQNIDHFGRNIYQPE